MDIQMNATIIQRSIREALVLTQMALIAAAVFVLTAQYVVCVIAYTIIWYSNQVFQMILFIFDFVLDLSNFKGFNDWNQLWKVYQ